MENRNIDGKVEIFTPYITKNGVKIFPKNGKVFHFWVNDDTSILKNK